MELNELVYQVVNTQAFSGSCGLVPGVDVNTRFEVNNGIVFKILRVTVNK